MKKTIWLTYDLGVSGDYKGLYAWLDDKNAIECGNNVAHVIFEIDQPFDDKKLVKAVKNSLEESVKFEASNRVYLIRSKKENGTTKFAGSFIIGKRKANPWEGFGTKPDDTIDEE